ncbi:MAG: discoidin domain-containing protein [Oscillospiraceae bacterium]
MKLFDNDKQDGMRDFTVRIDSITGGLVDAANKTIVYINDDEPPLTNVNVALGKPVLDSSSHYDSYPPTVMFDGIFDGSNRFATVGTGEKFVELDLLSPTRINNVTFYEAQSGGLGQRINNVRIECLVDGAWKTVANRDAYCPPSVDRFCNTITSQVKIFFTGPEKEPTVTEIEIYNKSTRPFISGAPESGASNQNVTLEADREVLFTVNGAQAEDYTTTLTLTEDGTYTITATDRDGYVSDTVTVTIDRVAPVLSSSFPDGALTNENVVFTADEEVSFYVNSVKMAEGTEFTLYDSGSYTVQAVDKAGNASESISVTIDKDGPVLTGVPEKGATRNHVTVSSTRTCSSM